MGCTHYMNVQSMGDELENKMPEFGSFEEAQLETLTDRKKLGGPGSRGLLYSIMILACTSRDWNLNENNLNNTLSNTANY